MSVDGSRRRRGCRVDMLRGGVRDDAGDAEPRSARRYQALSSKFIGGYPRLTQPGDVVASSGDRFGLRTETTGTVHATLNILVVDLRPLVSADAPPPTTQEEIAARRKARRAARKAAERADGGAEETKAEAKA